MLTVQVQGCEYKLDCSWKVDEGRYYITVNDSSILVYGKLHTICEPTDIFMRENVSHSQRLYKTYAGCNEYREIKPY